VRMDSQRVHGLASRVLLPCLDADDRRRLHVADCIYNQPGLQSAHFSDYINCLYRRTQDHIICL